ncbi:MAG: L,D-transpeptidase [Cyanobacteriota bacterium]|jgi:lipoprotein-anchoring transpeptidase ErfK/SrfK
MGRFLRPLATCLALAATTLLLAPRGARAIEPPPAATGDGRGHGTAVVNLPTVGASGASAAGASGSGSAAAPAALPRATAALTSNREILLELGKRTISLLDNGKVIRSWPVAVGEPATPTPTGRFAVRNKVVNPQYQSTKSGKNNPTIGAQGPLGDRWIGFHTTARDQFGIHGTPTAWEWTVRSRAAVSQGCVRMLTPHVRELFDKVEVGTPVVVKP